jgi:hypothetical protein
MTYPVNRDTTRLPGLFIYGAGGVLMALSLATIADVLDNAQNLHLPDPLLCVSSRMISLITGGVALLVSLVCLFGRRPGLPLTLIAWLITIFVAYQVGMMWGGGHRQWGYLGNLSATLQISPDDADGVMILTLAGLLLGSYAMLIWFALNRYTQNLGLWLHKKEIPKLPITRKRNQNTNSQQNLVRFLKIACINCGGRIEFPTNFFGEKIPCPHCHTTITLQKARNLKISCPGCQGRIEFPEYAVGETISCPLCRMNITLKDPT